MDSPIQELYLQGDFFNWPSPENVSRLAPPPNLLGLAPPLISLSVGIMLRSSDWPPPVLKKF